MNALIYKTTRPKKAPASQPGQNLLPPEPFEDILTERLTNTLAASRERSAYYDSNSHEFARIGSEKDRYDLDQNCTPRMSSGALYVRSYCSFGCTLREVQGSQRQSKNIPPGVRPPEIF